MNKIFLAAPLLIACTASAFAQAMRPAEYVATAGASDLFEKQSSMIVLQSTQNPRIKSFATMMIADHGKSTAMVKAAAMRAHVMAAPPKLMPPQVEMIAELRGERGTARDATYVAQQKAAHDQALSVQQAYAMDGTAAPLKAAAGKIVPVVQQHIAMLKAM